MPGKPSHGDIRKRELAMVHVAKKQLGLDDDLYHEILQAVAGVESAADLDADGRRDVIDYLKARGFRPVHKSAGKAGMTTKPAAEKEPLLSKVSALLADMGLPWAYADGIAKQAFKIERVRWLNPEQLYKLTQILILQHRREKAVNHNQEQNT